MTTLNLNSNEIMKNKSHRFHINTPKRRKRNTNILRPLLINCSFIVIRRICARQMHFTAFNLIATLIFLKF